MHSVFGLTQIISCTLFFFCIGGVLPPADGRVIVMGAGIDHAVRSKILGKIDARARIAKTELQHLHSGNAEPLTQRVHLLGNQAQVFSNEREIAQTRIQDMK